MEESKQAGGAHSHIILSHLLFRHVNEIYDLLVRFCLVIQFTYFIVFYLYFCLRIKAYYFFTFEINK